VVWRGMFAHRWRFLGVTGLALSLSFLPLTQGCGGDDEEEEETEPNPNRREMRELTLLSAPSETNQASMFAASGPSLRAVLDRLEEVRTDTHVVSLFVRLGPMGGSYGLIDDLAEGLQSVRDAGKPVHCHFETIDNTGYALAAMACDRITVTPAGMLDVVGVAAQVFYARTMLEHMGIVADIAHVGRFKDAAEPLVRDDMGPETRESLGGLVDDLHQRLIDAMVAGRDMTPEGAQAAIDSGPQDSATALSLHLVDGVEFDDEARTRCREAGTATRNVEIDIVPDPEPLGLGGLLSALSGNAPVEEVEGPRIVLAYLDGSITDAEEASGDGTAQAGPFIEGMREIAEDEDVRALVLRINSPGGSALASDRMWHAVRRVADRIPVIVSVGDMAASGGYYIAVAGHEIFAHEASIVGSIGVVGGKVSLDPLLDRIGVNPVMISRGRHATWSTLTALWTEEERAVVERLMGSTYERFVSRVSAGRSMEWNRVTAVAEGRVWSGHDGLEHGLIDRIGGLRAAIARARERAAVGDEVPIVEWPRERSVLETIAQTFGGTSTASARRDAMGAFLALPSPLRRAFTMAETFQHEHVLVAMPFVLDIH
jgi:protease-4